VRRRAGADVAYSDQVLEGSPVVSVVMPCLNEARSLPTCIGRALEAFRQLGEPGEVIVADNGSTDGSIEIAEAAGARVVHVSARGYGNALRVGIAGARGEFVVMGDADDSYDFSEVPNFVAKLREGYDLVMGNRFTGEIKPGAMPPLHRKLGNPLLSRTMRVLFGTKEVGDVQCGLRAFTKSAFDRMDLRTTGMEFASELVIKAARSGCRITEIPITLWPDKRERPPHLRSFPDGWRNLRFMLLMSPNWLFIVPGAVLGIVGFAAVTWLLPGPRQVGSTNFDLHTMVVGLVAALLGVQIVSIGIFAKLFSHSERFTTDDHRFERLIARMTLEWGLFIGLLIFGAGLAGDLWQLWQWRQTGFGTFFHERMVIFWSMILAVGVQVVFASFFMSMLGISRGTYIGDYERR
jgi:glycosyltransferase involved in cell wall biosynthesis